MTVISEPRITAGRCPSKESQERSRSQRRALFRTFGSKRSRRHVVFVSNNGVWGGSEELWSRTAVDLARKGVPVAAKVNYFQPPEERILNFIQHGIHTELRPGCSSLWTKAWRKVTRPSFSLSRQDLENFINSRNPALVVLSSGTALPPLEDVELCVDRNWRFVTIGQCNYVGWWPRDDDAERYVKSLTLAQRCYFVADANLRLVELQLGCKLENAEIVRNPFNVPADASPSWPDMQDTGALKFAFVGRLHPPSKGLDILLEALADTCWTERKWTLTLYGEGAMRKALERLVGRLRLAHRVVFAGFADDIQKVWAANHILVMPSRFEGLPLAVVEAMVCGRPVIATDVAGHSEVIEDGATGFLAKAPTVDAFRLALEQAWQRRFDLQQMGELAARRIRELVPADPIELFSEKLMTIAESE
jgi:glycosyltransferase involved in cell wall biosynthesis